MKIVTVRRISQVFFLALLVLFVVVASAGEHWWQLRGWPVNALLAADPLVAVSVALATGVLVGPLMLALVTLVVTIIFGRVFCGWVCPFGTMHQFVGWLGRRRKPAKAQIDANRYRRAQAIKYLVLTFLLAAAAGTLAAQLIRWSRSAPRWPTALVAAGLVVLAVLALGGVLKRRRRAAAWVLALAAVWVVAAMVLPDRTGRAASLQTGLLDPIPLVYRSLSLAVLPAVDNSVQQVSPVARHYQGTWVIGGIFIGALLANLIVPRFYCRFICPLGALLGVFSRFAVWRIGQRNSDCIHCRLCERSCEGACEPSGEIRTSECVLCGNCLDDCTHGVMGFTTGRLAAGQVASPDVSRRGVLLSLLGGLAAVPLIRLAGTLGENWNPGLIRPPGARGEGEFLKRCIKCGQCMRVCPTNVLQPAGLDKGIEAAWTPVLNNRIGSSGCRFNCVACSNICPTGALAPLSLDQRMGRGDYADDGPVRIGTAFVDRSRCLPWAMDRPCLVCQENCPVSPKAIFTRESYTAVRDGVFTVAAVDGAAVTLTGTPLSGRGYATGDYYLAPAEAFDPVRRRIVRHTSDTIVLDEQTEWDFPPSPGDRVKVLIRLQRPYVDPSRCIGCGVCEHECPVSGQRAIRVTAENETRSRERSLLL